MKIYTLQIEEKITSSTGNVSKMFRVQLFRTLERAIEQYNYHRSKCEKQDVLIERDKPTGDSTLKCFFITKNVEIEVVEKTTF